MIKRIVKHAFKLFCLFFGVVCVTHTLNLNELVNLMSNNSMLCEYTVGMILLSFSIGEVRDQR